MTHSRSLLLNNNKIKADSLTMIRDQPIKKIKDQSQVQENTISTKRTNLSTTTESQTMKVTLRYI